MSINREINKMWNIHVVEYYSAIKRNEVLIHATTCMHLDSIMAKQKKPDIKGHILYYFIYMKYPEQANQQRQKDYWLLGILIRRNEK